MQISEWNILCQMLKLSIKLPKSLKDHKWKDFQSPIKKIYFEPNLFNKILILILKKRIYIHGLKKESNRAN